MCDERELGSEHPPFTFERQVTASHLSQRNVPAPADFRNMLIQARTERSLALRGPSRGFANVHQPVLVV